MFTKYADNTNNTNFVLDLVFFSFHNRKFNYYDILLNFKKPSDYTFFIIKMKIQSKNIDIINNVKTITTDYIS